MLHCLQLTHGTATVPSRSFACIYCGWHLGSQLSCDTMEHLRITAKSLEALRRACSQVFKRVDTGRREEEYQLIGSFDEEPDGSKLTPLFSGQPQGVLKPWWQL